MNRGRQLTSPVGDAEFFAGFRADCAAAPQPDRQGSYLGRSYLRPQNRQVHCARALPRGTRAGFVGAPHHAVHKNCQAKRLAAFLPGNGGCCGSAESQPIIGSKPTTSERLISGNGEEEKGKRKARQHPASEDRHPVEISKPSIEDVVVFHRRRPLERAAEPSPRLLQPELSCFSAAEPDSINLPPDEICGARPYRRGPRNSGRSPSRSSANRGWLRSSSLPVDRPERFEPEQKPFEHSAMVSLFVHSSNRARIHAARIHAALSAFCRDHRITRRTTCSAMSRRT